MNVQWYGLLPFLRLNPHHPFFLTASTSSTKRRAAHTRSVPVPHWCPVIRLALRPPGRLRDSPLKLSRSPESPRGISGACAHTRPARPVDATRIRACPRGPADSTRDG